MDIVSLFRGILGMSVILGIAFIISRNKTRVSIRLVTVGLSLQLLLAIFILRGEEMAAYFAPLGWPKAFFAFVSYFFVLVLRFTEAGTQFVFGSLGLPTMPIGEEQTLGVVFAFHILPTIIFFASLMAILYHLGIMQRIVELMARAMAWLMGTSGAESLSVTANIFVGQTESPLVVRPYLAGLTQSELLAVMTGGMATIAGGVMAAYIAILGNAFAAAQGIPLMEAEQLFAEQLLGASLMAAPAALVLAKIMIPEVTEPVTRGHVKIQVEARAQNSIDAAARGAADGLKLAANVGGMLIAFIALIAMINYILAWGGGFFGWDLSLEFLLGWTLAPIAWLIGVPWADAVQFGSLLGTKIVLNEFVAYLMLGETISDGLLGGKAIVMATFALCGFANFSSIAIQIGGIGPIAPTRKSDLAQLGMRAVLAGTLANMMTATIAGVLIGGG